RPAGGADGEGRLAAGPAGPEVRERAEVGGRQGLPRPGVGERGERQGEGGGRPVGVGRLDDEDGGVLHLVEDFEGDVHRGPGGELGDEDGPQVVVALGGAAGGREADAGGGR